MKPDLPMDPAGFSLATETHAGPVHSLCLPEGQGRLMDFFRDVRAATARLTAGLSDADATPQSMPDASPAKWHLAHTTWFFEVMVLRAHLPGYRAFDEAFDYLFNSYYDALGDRHPRASRGLITRPSLEHVIRYREHVDSAMERLTGAECPREVLELVELGCHHEQQHQELLLTDLLHLFAQNPLRPVFREPIVSAHASHEAAPLRYRTVAGGLVSIGAADGGFSFDSEGPAHRVQVDDFKLADRLTTNREWLGFVADGGYRDPRLWLSDGWAKVKSDGWRYPLYWEDRSGEMWTMTRGACGRLS